jgi:hypothetical protein
MKIRAVLIVSLVSFVLVACASTSSSVAPAVQVAVSADDTVAKYVNTGKLREVTEAALRKHAANAGPATVVVRLDSLLVASPEFSRSTEIAYPSAGRRVPVASPEPWNEPSQPVVGTHGPSGAIGSVPTARPLVRGTYTIADANGAVLERKPIAIPLDYRGEPNVWLEAHRSVAAHVARRVAVLTAPR